MHYNQQQQGFGQNPGGVAYGGAPTHPPVNVSPEMQQYVTVITAKLYNDMVQRGTQYTNFMAAHYAQNGFNNEQMATAIQAASEYAEYMMSKHGGNFNSIIDIVVQDCNSLMLETHLRNNPNSIPVPVTQNEMIRYQAIRSRMAAIRQEIGNFLSQREQRMSNNMAHQQGQFPMHTGNSGLYPNQNQMSQQQMQYYQQQQAQLDQQAYQQQLLQQQRQNNAYGHQQSFGQQPPPQHYQQQFQQSNPHMQQHNQQGSGFGFPPAQAGMYNGMVNPHMQQQMNQGFQNRGGNMGAFATSSQQLQQMHNNQSPPPGRLPSHGTYDPMPMVDNSQLERPSKPQMTTIDTNPAPRKETHLPPGFNNHLPQGTPINKTADDKARARVTYVRQVYAKADELGLPTQDVSLSLLEDSIVRMDPNNGIIDRRNAYSEVNRNARPVQPDGPYSRNLPIDQSVRKEVVPPSQSFANKVQNDMKATEQSDKLFIKQPDDQYLTVTKSMQEDFHKRYPGQDIYKADIKAALNTENTPYPFAKRNMKGEWIVSTTHFKDITSKGGFIYNVAYPRNTHEGFYVVDDNGTIIDFYIRPLNSSEDNMDFAMHDDTKFFTPMSKQDVGVTEDNQKLLDTFSKLQNEKRIEEVIRDIESQSDVLSVDEDKLVVDQTIVFDEQTNGNYVGDDYCAIAKVLLEHHMGDIKYDTKNVAYRYIHAHLYDWGTTEESLAIVRKFRYKDNYKDILAVLEAMAESEDVPSSWFTRLNQLATNYVNNVIKTQFTDEAITSKHMRSFTLDCEDALQLMDNHGYAEKFNATAKELAQTLLYPWLNNSRVYEDYYGETNDDESSTEVNDATFGILRDITVIPLHSRYVPIQSETGSCLLTEHGFTSLWAIAKDRIDNKNANVSEVIIVTSDNRAMYISKSAIDGVYVLSTTSQIVA